MPVRTSTFVLADAKCHTYQPRVQSINIYNLCLSWYWTPMLWSIDSCQIRWLVSHKCMLRCSNNWVGCFKFSTDQLLVYNWSLAQLHLFKTDLVCFLPMMKVELLQRDISLRIPRKLGFWPWLNLYITPFRPREVHCSSVGTALNCRVGGRGFEFQAELEDKVEWLSDEKLKNIFA